MGLRMGLIKELKKVLIISMNKGLNLGRQKETGPHLEWKALMFCYGINNSFPELFLLSRSRCASAPFSNEKRVGSLMWIFPDRIHWNSSAVLLVRSSWVVRTFQRSPPINALDVSINILGSIFSGSPPAIPKNTTVPPILVARKLSIKVWPTDS